VADRCRSCPHIVKLLDAFARGGQVHLVYEHAGRDLSRVLVASSPTPHQISTCMRHTLTGIRHIHSLGLLHADIKPCNIMVQDQQEWFVRLCDVGSVVEVWPGNNVHYKQSGVRMHAIQGRLCFQRPLFLPGSCIVGHSGPL
jgi:serine/threonine protein kinase